MGDWISSLQTDTLQRGFELALLLARKGIAYTQPSAEVRRELREVYAKNANSLIIASHFVAAYF